MWRFDYQKGLPRYAVKCNDRDGGAGHPNSGGKTLDNDPQSPEKVRSRRIGRVLEALAALGIAGVAITGGGGPSSGGGIGGSRILATFEGGGDRKARKDKGDKGDCKLHLELCKST